ncbi:hypothetical protein [Kutzneria albida]|uniref:Secreted protein n=1 Tax=Kutzneria albida DSM 43870 TaxID=1449976 RepID=W5WFZ1_9PSEU|nr:hypothetical protein [Kutzneria albida]AHH99762.1 hypothetical protein KALB_6402 [Kutzneria albida DSM 43870]
MREPLRRMTGVLAAALAVAMVGAGVASADPQAPPTTINVNFKIDGTTYLKKIDATMTLGTGKLISHLVPGTGEITADLQLPPATLSYKQFGILPVSSTVELESIGQTTGKLDKGVVTSHSTMRMHLKTMSVAGLPIPIGDNCASAEPDTIDLVSGPGFNILKGGDLLGTYSVGQFANCGLAGLLINALVPGPDNTIKLTLSSPTRP